MAAIVNKKKVRRKLTLGDIMSGIPIIPDLNDFRSLLKVNLPHDDAVHGLRTPNEGISPVHVVLVSLLVNQLSSLFLPFLVNQKKIV